MPNKSHTRKNFLIVSCALLLQMPVLAYAQGEGTAEPTSAGEESILFEEIPSVYGASKYEQRLTDAPSSVSIITADEIKKYGYRNLADILQSIRGYNVRNDRNYEYAGIRGFGLPQDYSSRIVLLIDGHKFNDNVYGEAAIFNVLPVDIDLIETVEVVRGPSSSMYGTGASLGVINITTKKGRDYKGVEASGSVGSYDSSKSRLTYGNRFQNGVEMLLSGSYSESDGDDHLYYKEFDRPSTNNGIASDLDGEWYKNIYGKVSFQDVTLQGAYSFRKKDVPTAPFGTLFNTKPMWTEDEKLYLDLQYKHTFANQLTLRANLDYNQSEYAGEYPYDFEMPGYFLYKAVNRDTADGEWVHGEAQLQKFIGEKHRVTFGMDYQYDLAIKQENYDKTAGGVYPYLDDDRESWHMGGYLQEEFFITDTLTLNMGLRYDYYETIGSTVNPRTALIYNPFEKTIFKLLYGRAVRAPNAYELYYSDGYTSKDNPGLDEESVNTFELMVEQYFGKHYRGTVAGYYYQLDDPIAQVLDRLDGKYVFQNLDKIDSYGVEFELEGKWEGGLEGTMSYAVQNLKNHGDDINLSNAPKHLIKLNLIVPLMREKIFLGIEEQYVSKRETVYDTELEDFAITNLTLFGTNLIKGCELSASIYNLFDKKYKDPGGDEHRQEGIEQDGRTWRVKLTYAF